MRNTRSLSFTALAWAHYVTRWWRMNLKTARSLRTHLPSHQPHRTAAGGESVRAQVISCTPWMFRAGRPSRFAGGRRYVVARSQGFVFAFLALSRICGVVHNERVMKVHFRSSLSLPSGSGSKARSVPPLPTPNPSFKRTCQGLRPCPSA
jgi:hypothetical protein